MGLFLAMMPPNIRFGFVEGVYCILLEWVGTEIVLSHCSLCFYSLVGMA